MKQESAISPALSDCTSGALFSARDAGGTGIARGTLIMTADGMLPVEFLCPGDRIVTHSGMCVLEDIDTPAPHRFALSFARAQAVYADGVLVQASTGAPLF
ncbi:Hint domain-containing protein [Celeribacter arenosi]|uniref:Hedgehog/Intein (Hint) domain-containing protein n=1 Tax=Celeribacter arenosi TaxID=792649 RepID=A0ABP7KCM3_9RHOB